MDQRRLIIVAQSVVAVLIFLLATVTLLDLVAVWHILTVAFVTGAVEAFDQPARRSLYPYLIDRSDMLSAVAMNSTIWSGTRIVAPAVAGFIVAWVGTAAAFYVAGLGFLAMALATFSIQTPSVTRTASRGAGHDLIEGLQFIRQNTIFSFLIALTFFNSFFGMAYTTLMPMFAVDILKVGANGKGCFWRLAG